MPDPILAIGARRDNAQLMLACRDLGYLPGPVIDLTYGWGRFWSKYRPKDLVTNDANPTRASDHHHDFRSMPFPDQSFATAVLDGPYKLNGKSTGRGPSASDLDYGVGDKATAEERHELIRQGMTEGARLAAVYLLVKCQDQVNSGRVHWQTRIFADHGETLGFTLEDMLHVKGWRKQPDRWHVYGADGRKMRGAAVGGAQRDEMLKTLPAGARLVEAPQEHAGRDYSTLLVLRRTGPTDPSLF